MTAAEDRCLWTLDRIDPYVDGDLAAEEIAKVAGHLADCPDCREELALARAVAQELRTLPALECPPRVVEDAAARLGTVGRKTLVQRLFEWFGGRNVSVRCSQCEATVIYGCPCHEHGCPNRNPEPSIVDEDDCD